MEYNNNQRQWEQINHNKDNQTNYESNTNTNYIPSYQKKIINDYFCEYECEYDNNINYEKQYKNNINNIDYINRQDIKNQENNQESDNSQIKHKGNYYNNRNNINNIPSQDNYNIINNSISSNNGINNINQSKINTISEYIKSNNNNGNFSNNESNSSNHCNSNNNNCYNSHSKNNFNIIHPGPNTRKYKGKKYISKNSNLSTTKSSIQITNNIPSLNEQNKNDSSINCNVNNNSSNNNIYYEEKITKKCYNNSNNNNVIIDNKNQSNQNFGFYPGNFNNNNKIFMNPLTHFRGKIPQKNINSNYFNHQIGNININQNKNYGNNRGIPKYNYIGGYPYINATQINNDQDKLSLMNTASSEQQQQLYINGQKNEGRNNKNGYGGKKNNMSGGENKNYKNNNYFYGDKHNFVEEPYEKEREREREIYCKKKEILNKYDSFGGGKIIGDNFLNMFDNTKSNKIPFRLNNMNNNLYNFLNNNNFNNNIEINQNILRENENFINNKKIGQINLRKNNSSNINSNKIYYNYLNEQNLNKNINSNIGNDNNKNKEFYYENDDKEKNSNLNINNQKEENTKNELIDKGKIYEKNNNKKLLFREINLKLMLPGVDGKKEEKELIMNINQNNIAEKLKQIIFEENIDNDNLQPLLSIVENSLDLLKIFDEIKITKYSNKEIRNNNYKRMFFNSNYNSYNNESKKNDSFILDLIENNNYRNYIEEDLPDVEDFEKYQNLNLSV